MKAWITTLTASEAIALGACDGRCMVASKDVCDCVCGGAYHGVLAGSAIGEVTHTIGSADSTTSATVRRHKMPRLSTPSASTPERMVDLRMDGHTSREIAELTGVSRSTVSKRLNEFAEPGGAA